jgi:hypothetical protein
MKNNLIKKIAVAASVVCLTGMAQATLITGNIGFSGAVDLNSTSVNSATEVTSWLNTVAASPSGSFVPYVNNGDTVSMTGATPWSFSSGALPNFWSVDGFTFNLASSSIVSQVGGYLNVALLGSVTGNGFTSTTFDGSFQVADPASGGPETYTERLSFNSVPDGGTTVVLLGLGLLSLGLFRKQMLVA